MQSPVMEDQVATPDMQEEPLRRLDYSTSGSIIPTQVLFLKESPFLPSQPVSPSTGPHSQAHSDAANARQSLYTKLYLHLIQQSRIICSGEDVLSQLFAK